MKPLILPLFAAAAFLSPSVLSAAVINFNSASDLAQFNQVDPSGNPASFWSHQNTAGFGGSGGIVGATSPNAGWAVLNTPISLSSPISGGVLFKLGKPSVASNGFNLYFGVGPSANFAPNTGNVVDSTKNYFAAALQVRVGGTTENRTYTFQNYTTYSTNGTRTQQGSASAVSLAYDEWYYLGLEATRDEQGWYDLSAKVYSVNSSGTMTEIVGLGSTVRFQLAGLTDAENNYFFFGVPGQAVTRGVLAVDNFTYNAVPEAGSIALFSGGLAALFLIGGKRAARKHAGMQG